MRLASIKLISGEEILAEIMDYIEEEEFSSFVHCAIPSGEGLLKEKFLAIGFSQLDIVERIRQKDVGARI